jgi:predicted RNA-binding protein with PIN domain
MVCTFIFYKIGIGFIIKDISMTRPGSWCFSSCRDVRIHARYPLSVFMPYLIDGHNLIPFISGLALDQVDDEMALVSRLVPFFRSVNKKAVVYFDQAFPGSQTRINRGNLNLLFIRPPRTADEAILSDLARMGGDARNCTVVTSDTAVRASAQSAGARVMSSAQFSRLLSGKKPEIKRKEEPDDDVDYWLHMFEKGPENS